MSGSWVDDEPGWPELRSELARAARRARMRWLRTVLLTVALTAGLIAWRAHKPRMYKATVVFQVTEGRFDPQSAPPTGASLQDHIWNVTLSASRLLEVIQQFHLYPTRMRSDPSWAVESMRDDLDVKVVRNFFSQERSAGDPPRSARLAISYQAQDSQLAHDVVTELGRRVAEQQTEQRKRSARAGAEHAQVATTRLREQLDDVRTEQARLNMAYATASAEDAPLMQLRLRDVTADITALEAQLAQAERASLDYDLRTAYEGQDMGLRFDMIDPGRPPALHISRNTELAVFGITMFVLLAPFVVLGVGVFDWHVDGAEDVMRLGLEPFGHVPSFPGDGLGALVDRLPRNRGGA